MYFLEKLPTFDVGLLENVSDHSRQYWIDISKKKSLLKKKSDPLTKIFCKIYHIFGNLGSYMHKNLRTYLSI